MAQKSFKAQASDPKNMLTSLTSGWATFVIDGTYATAPIYVDPDGFVRVRMPDVEMISVDPAPPAFEDDPRYTEQPGDKRL